FLKPKFMGKLLGAQGVGNTQNLKCGDVMRIYLKVSKKKGEDKEVISEIKFETMGCGHAIASTDMICELALGKTLEQAKKIKFSDVSSRLGEMPPQKLHCSSLAQYALKEAIKDYEGRYLK
ncbi:iron-sulfur cluster assembly scaffold protein, partial [Candidatus Parcubacteria bacterium]|nr:iron-sulfur cluster assembly scaffold protein [Candidatus Parcubacteria bacterium]